MKGRMNKWIYECKEGRLNKWINEWKEGWVNELMNELLITTECLYIKEPNIRKYLNISAWVVQGIDLIRINERKLNNILSFNFLNADIRLLSISLMRRSALPKILCPHSTLLIATLHPNSIYLMQPSIIIQYI